MNIDIRKSIKNNFKGTDEEEIESAINESIQDNNELALPGLGVFFEVLWNNSESDFQKQILKIIKRSLI